jgi:hypothetical protein
MTTIQSRCDVRGGVHSEITMTDGRPPWDDGKWQGYAWRVTLRYQGRQMTVPFFTGELAGEPTTADVLHCLLSDATSVLTARDWVDWAQDMGYESLSDADKAREIYEACQSIGDRLETLLGDDFETFAYELERM